MSIVLTLILPRPCRTVHGCLLRQMCTVCRNSLHICPVRVFLAAVNQASAFEQGNSALLLNLYGSLPVSFRGTTYAFPVSIWIPREYPQMAPMNFVTPTKDMVVRPGQYISGEGRVYHPYLAGWKDDVSFRVESC